MSAVELSQTKYATRRKNLLSVINQLRAGGAQEELNLPKIAVIGNQSAGKSSIVEAISGITVPRSGGTCTRCVFECRLSSAPKWSCRISIRHEFTPSGDRLRTGIREHPFGDTITDPKKVELQLRRAQAAVLLDDWEGKVMLNASEESLGSWSARLGGRGPAASDTPEAVPDTGGNESVQPPENKLFSKNSVCIDLEGPDYTDLAFVDLPGLIAAESPETVRLVEDIVTSHIQGNSLILVALPMTDDMMNQKALQLARQVDPHGHRTIGVLTKPDMLTSGSIDAHTHWIQVLSGNGPYPLKHGYFCTKQPDDEQRRLGITASDARTSENLYFETAKPWVGLRENDVASGIKMRERFGMQKLVTRLSDLLVQIIGTSLPSLQISAERLMRQAQDELSRLPKAPSSEPFSELLQLLSAFSDDINSRVRGTSYQQADFDIWSSFPGENGTKGTTVGFSQNSRGSSDSARFLIENKLIHDNRTSYHKLKRSIQRTAPRFMPYTKSATRKHVAQAEMELAIDTDDEMVFDINKDDDEGVYSGKGTIMHMDEGGGASTIKMDLDDVRSHIRWATTRELPGNVPFQAKAALITAAQSNWHVIVQQCAENVRRSLLQALIECAQVRFNAYSGLNQKIQICIMNIINDRFATCTATLNSILEAEKTPFTQNTHYLSASTDTWYSKYQQARALYLQRQKKQKPFVGFTTFTDPEDPTAISRSIFSSAPLPLPEPKDSTADVASSPFANVVGAAELASPKAPKSKRAKSKASAPDNSRPTASTLGATPMFSSSSSGFYPTTYASGSFSGNPVQPGTLGGAARSTTATGFGAWIAPTPAQVVQTAVPGSPTPRVTSSTSSPGLSHTSTTIDATNTTTSSHQVSAPSPAAREEMIKQAMGLLAQANCGTSLNLEQFMMKLQPGDEFDTEMRVMAEVRGYFKVAYKRIIDIVPSLIDLQLVKAVAQDMHAFVIQKLELDQPDGKEKCAGYLQQDPEVKKRREEMNGIVERMRMAQVELFKLSA